MMVLINFCLNRESNSIISIDHSSICNAISKVSKKMAKRIKIENGLKTASLYLEFTSELEY